MRIQFLSPPTIANRETAGSVFDNLARLKQRRLIERLTDQLQAEWRSLLRQSGRHRDPRKAGHVDRYRQDILQVHSDRIASFLALRKGRRRCRRRQDQIDLIPGLVEILLDQLAHFLCLEVVGIVIAGRQNIGADEDPSLDLRPEACSPRLLIAIDQIIPRNSESITDTIIAGEVG